MDHEEQDDTSGDSGRIEHSEETEIISAAKLAGEEGGVSCMAAPNNFMFFAFLFSIIVVLTRFRGVLKNENKV